MNFILKHLIKKNDVISFDIFDTLIKRNCFVHTDVFRIVEYKYNKEHYDNKISFFYERINAEKDARNCKNNQEITINDIYDKMVFDKKIKEELKQLEFDTENNICQKNYKMYDIYKYCESLNKKIIFVTDMYLPFETIEKILKQNGYLKGKIYLSNKYNKSKYHGDLFDYVKTEFSKKTKILHIGDSLKSDAISPLFHGLSSYHIKRVNNNISYFKYDNTIDESLEKSIVCSLINNNSYILENDYEKFGYEIIGPLCYSYCNYINRIAKHHNIQNLHFY